MPTKPTESHTQSTVISKMRYAVILLFCVFVVLQYNFVYSGRHYVATRKTWYEAMAECERRNMSLMIARSRAKMQEIIDASWKAGAFKDECHKIWLGVKRDKYPDKFPYVWRYASIDYILIERPFWADKAPGIRRCVTVNVGHGNPDMVHRWMTAPCDHKHAFFCEYI